MRQAGLITLSDLPELTGKSATPRAKITIGRLDGNLRDPRYGKFSITQADVDSWKRNLAGVFGGQVSMDFDHSSDRGNGTRAACWVTSIDQTGTKDGSLITADVQFTRRGAKAVRDGDYKYTSPTFVENYTDEHGQKHGKALIGGALTNRPVLRKGMPTLSLSRDHFDDVATAPAGRKASRRERKHARRQLAKLHSDSQPARDSRGQMPDLKEIAKLLGLSEDADQVTVLAAVAGLKPPSNDSSDGDANNGTPPAGSKKARKKAAKKAARKLARENEDGSLTLSADQVADLMTNANAGAAAAKQLIEERFQTAWSKALSEGRAAPSQEETIKALFKENPDLAIKTLDSFVAIVPVKPTGSGEGATAEAPAGMDAERFALHTEAKALAAKKLEADPKLDAGEAYILATQEIEERKFTMEHPGI